MIDLSVAYDDPTCSRRLHNPNVVIFFWIEVLTMSLKSHPGVCQHLSQVISIDLAIYEKSKIGQLKLPRYNR